MQRSHKSRPFGAEARLTLDYEVIRGRLSSTAGFVKRQDAELAIRPVAAQSGRWTVATHDIVVIGASAGGVEALSHVLATFPRDLRASVLVVLHLARGRSMLPEILSRAGPLPASHPKDGDRLEHGRVYVARPDHHLIVEPGRVRVVHGPNSGFRCPVASGTLRSCD